eukprot:1435797-Amphidinium_carterae.1
MQARGVPEAPRRPFSHVRAHHTLLHVLGSRRWATSCERRAGGHGRVASHSMERLGSNRST